MDEAAVRPDTRLGADATASAPALLLRPWRDDDAPALLAACRDPALRRWTSHRVADEADAHRWLRREAQAWQRGERLAFAVLETPSDGGEDVLAGQAVLKGLTPRSESAEVGYWTAAHARGRGVAPRALRALTDWAFTAHPWLTRLELLHQADNTASCRVAHKSGYPYERSLPAVPPDFPSDGHLHVRRATARG
ncbi:GNAT family N-acetyltransferase [Streptomyces sp. bgisy159]|uniref:GNAT family N-acetyltransferase n=1 Tax=Streptomyces sp. bgisy159 TaxID=3413795 RepID=UPI003F4A619C